MMDDQRNLLLAIVLSIAIIVGFNFLFEGPKQEAQPSGEPTTAQGTAPAEAPAKTAPGAPQAAPGGDASVPSAPQTPTGEAGRTEATPPGAAPRPSDDDRERVLARTPRVTIDSARLHGSMALPGARIDDLTLADYRVGLEPNSPEITLLSPPGVDGAYYAQFGWVSDKEGLRLPDAGTDWQADGDVLAPGRRLVLSWDNGAGLRFVRIVELDKSYMFTVTQRVENTSGADVTLYPYGLVSRSGTPPVSRFYILHEGPLGVFDGTLKEVDYDDLKEDGPVEMKAQRGWIGITDKYWLVALLPTSEAGIKSRFFYEERNGIDKYQVDYLGGSQVVPAGGSVEVTNRLFAGAKEVDLLDSYSESLDLQHLDKAIDFGWFYFLTKPLFKVLQVFYRYTGNFGVAILLLTVLIKIAFFPLANKSYRSMSKMKALQPEMVKLRERHSDDKQRLNQEMMQLYKRHKVNPTSGCLPIVIQIPVFFALYKVLFVTIEMRQAPFFGWIKDLSQQDPTTLFNLFGLVPWQPPDFLMIGVWPLIMGLSMFAQQKLNPQPPDPVQAKIFMFLPLVFTIMLARFPAGLVIYWAWNNMLTIAQQWFIMRQSGVAKPAAS